MSLRLFRHEIVRFLVLYLFFMLLFLALIGLRPVKQIVDLNGLYTRLVVSLAALALKPFGVVTGKEGSIIHLKGISLNVLFGCNGLEAFFIYTAAVLAFRAPWRTKLLGIILGFLVLQVLNILRIAALGLVGIYLRTYFYYFHLYVAQGIMVVLALALFLIYMTYALRQN